MRPFQRGFFCDDQSLRYPYHDCTISNSMLLICMLLLPLLFIGIFEVIRVCNNFALRRYLRNLWRSVATFSFGFIATFLSTELAKQIIGRLRPHFYAACEPRLPDGSTCQDAVNQGRFIERYLCSNRDLSPRQLRELHVSFPSAHSSLSFFSMVFLCFYLHAAWRGRAAGCRYLRHALQFVLLLLAWSVALSRVADYWHHWSDVLAGALMGVAFAVLAAVYVGGFLCSDSGQQHTTAASRWHRHDPRRRPQHHQQLQQQPQQQQQQQQLMRSTSDWKLQTVLTT